jgi:hypothetical protein
VLVDRVATGTPSGPSATPSSLSTVAASGGTR